MLSYLMEILDIKAVSQLLLSQLPQLLQLQLANLITQGLPWPGYVPDRQLVNYQIQFKDVLNEQDLNCLANDMASAVHKYFSPSSSWPMKSMTDMEDKKDIKEPLDLLTSLSTFPLVLEVWDSMYCTASCLEEENS